MRLLLCTGLALSLSACVSFPCIGQDPATTIAWTEPDLVAKTAGLEWDPEATLPMPVHAGLPEEGAALLTIVHHVSGLELRAHNTTHARVMAIPEPNATGLRERFLRLVQNATDAAPAQEEAWADEFARVTEVPFEGMEDITSERHVVHLPVAQLRVQAWWQEEPREKQQAKDSWESRHWHKGDLTSWEVKTEERFLRGDGARGHARLFGHGLVHISVGAHVSEAAMRDIAAS